MSGAVAVNRDQTARTARGVLAEAFHPSGAISRATTTSQTIYCSLVGLAAGDVVTNLCVIVGVVGAGTAPTMLKLALVDAATGNVVAATANESANTKWTTGTGPKSFALSAQYTVLTTGGYYVAFLQNGAFASTGLEINYATNAVASTKSLDSNPRPHALGGTGKTDITGTLTFADIAGNNAHWLGVS